MGQLRGVREEGGQLISAVAADMAVKQLQGQQQQWGLLIPAPVAYKEGPDGATQKSYVLLWGGGETWNANL